jgi:hypothetical protein
VGPSYPTLGFGNSRSQGFSTPKPGPAMSMAAQDVYLGRLLQDSSAHTGS